MCHNHKQYLVQSFLHPKTDNLVKPYLHPNTVTTIQLKRSPSEYRYYDPAKSFSIRIPLLDLTQTVVLTQEHDYPTGYILCRGSTIFPRVTGLLSPSGLIPSTVF